MMPPANTHHAVHDSDASPVPAYGTSRPRLPARAMSLTITNTPSGSSSANNLKPTTTLRQTGSLRALYRLTSTAGAVDSVAPAPPRSPRRSPLATPSLRQARSLRGHRAGAKETLPLLRRSLTTSQIPPLVRAMSSVLRLPREEETFRCHICFDDVVVSAAVTLSSCGHKYCTDCFQSYLEIKIREGNVYPVCFHPVGASTSDDDSINTRKTCGVAVDARQIEALVDPEVWKKFNLFRFNKEHEHARECPHCTFPQDCDGPERPECVCVQCNKTFCFFHDIAHDGGSCADYELQNAEAESINRAKIKEIAKPCPGCQRDVEKDGGCNHMKCVVCQTSFCWLCREIIEDVPMPSHYSSSSESPCSGKQFDENGPIELPWQVTLYAIVVAILCYPIALVCAVVVTPISLCRRSSSSSDTVSDLFWFNHTIAMIWLALLISLVVFIVAIVVELTVRLVVFGIALPFVMVKAMATKAVSCCRRRQDESQPITAPTTDALSDDSGCVDLEAGPSLTSPSTTAKRDRNGDDHAVAA